MKIQESFKLSSMASTLFSIFSQLLTELTAIIAIPTHIIAMSAATTTVVTPVLATPLFLIYATVSLVVVCVAMWEKFGEAAANLVLGLSSLQLQLQILLINGIFGIQRGVGGSEPSKPSINHPYKSLIYVPIPVEDNRKGKQKSEEKSVKENRGSGGGGGGGDEKKKKTENVEEDQELNAATVEIRKFTSESDDSTGELVEEVDIQDCPSWNKLAHRIHEVWMSIDWIEGDSFPEDVNPSNCWPGYEVSYWCTTDDAGLVKKRVSWTHVDWHHVKHRLSVVRLVPLHVPLITHYFI